MALTFPRWIALLVAACLFAATIQFQRRVPPAREVDPREALTLRQRMTARHASQAVERLRTLQLRDSMRVVLARPSTEPVRVIASPTYPPDFRNAFAALMTRVRLGQTYGAATPVDIAFIHDRARSLRGSPIERTWMSLAYVLPTQANGRCQVIARLEDMLVLMQSGVQRQQIVQWLASPAVASRIMGPCAFYSNYGPPGPEIARWLQRGGWTFAEQQLGNRQPGVWESNWWRRRVGWERAAGFPLRDYASLVGYRCLSGDPAACETEVLGSTRHPQYQWFLREAPTGLVMARNSEYYQGGHSLGPREPLLLSQMASDLGPDRFRQFWTSKQAPAEAFRAATGEGLGTWVVGWAQRNYGEHGSGPHTPPIGGLLGAVIAVLSLGATIAVSARRQMT